jgi:hypothetical protein
VIDRRGVAAILVAGAFSLPRGVLRDAPTLCPFRRVTGLPCPTCGLTRSWQAAAHLRLRDSLAYHPLGAATFVAAVMVALAEPSAGTGMAHALAQRREVRLSAAAVWLATWAWRVRRATTE